MAHTPVHRLNLCTGLQIYDAVREELQCLFANLLGIVVEYAIIGEGTVVGAGAHIGAQPDGTDGWGVATVGPDTAVPAGGTVPAGAMIYDGAEVHV